MKHEWRKHEKNRYLPKPKPELIDIEPMTFLALQGQGSPDSKQFQDCVGALYSLSYGIKMAPRKGINIPGYFDYTVYPLEGVWDLDEEGRKLYQDNPDVATLRDHFVFHVMIRQPEFVTEELLNQVKELKSKKDKNPYLLDASLVTLEEGRCCQMLHVGPYADEPASFAKMETYCKENGYVRSQKSHREIYISDPSKTAPEKLKTTIRFRVHPVTE